MFDRRCFIAGCFVSACSIATSGLAYDAVDIAFEQLTQFNSDKEYVWYGNGIDGFDCSGLTKYAYGHVGIDLPRITSCKHVLPNDPTATGCSTAQESEGVEIVNDVTTPENLGKLRRGDLLFFDTQDDGVPNDVNHVGIYVSDGEFIHAQWPDVDIIRSNFNNSWWQSHFLFARRLTAPQSISRRFVDNDLVELKGKANVRGDPLGRDTVAIGGNDEKDKNPDLVRNVVERAPPAQGRIRGRPIYSGYYTTPVWRWYVDFESGPDGWVAEDFLEKSNVPPPPPFTDVLSRTVISTFPQTLVYEPTGYGYRRIDRFTNISTSPVRLDSVQFIYLDPDDVGIRNASAENFPAIRSAAESLHPDFDFWGLNWIGGSDFPGQWWDCANPLDPAFIDPSDPGYIGHENYVGFCGDPDTVIWTNSMTTRSLGGIVLHPGEYVDIEHTPINNLIPECTPDYCISKYSELVVGFKFTGSTSSP